MTTYFVSRHPGATVWAREEGIQTDRLVPHLDIEAIKTGDVVIGSLPINLAASVCQRGAAYIHLSLNVPAQARGKELGPEEMRCYGAALRRYIVQQASDFPDITANC